MTFGGYRTMWLLVMFDLPTDDREARKEYSRFRKNLLNSGFLMLQYSVYARPCPSIENTEVHKKRVREALPPDGEVRVAVFTDKQFERMELYLGKRRFRVEKQPDQLSFF